MNRLVLKT